MGVCGWGAGLHSSVGLGFFPQSLASVMIDLGKNCLEARPRGEGTVPVHHPIG